MKIPTICLFIFWNLLAISVTHSQSTLQRLGKYVRESQYFDARQYLPRVNPPSISLPYKYILYNYSRIKCLYSTQCYKDSCVKSICPDLNKIDTCQALWKFLEDTNKLKRKFNIKYVDLTFLSTKLKSLCNPKEDKQHIEFDPQNVLFEFYPDNLQNDRINYLIQVYVYLNGSVKGKDLRIDFRSTNPKLFRLEQGAVLTISELIPRDHGYPHTLKIRRISQNKLTKFDLTVIISTPDYKSYSSPIQSISLDE